MRTLLIPLLGLLAGCPTAMERKCHNERDTVTAADCYTAGLNEGYDAGLAFGEIDGAAAATNECDAAGESASSYDSADSSSSGCDCGGGGGESGGAALVILLGVPAFLLKRRRVRPQA